MSFNIILVFCMLVHLSFDTGYGARTKEKIYVDMEGHHACFRRLNATSQVGCSTGRNGNVGIVHYIENISDVNWLIDVGPHQPYIVLLTPTMFTRNIVETLDNSKKINGILVIHNNDSESPLEFSVDKTCPNDNMDLYSTNSNYAHCKNVTWNTAGNSLFYDDFDIPIFAISNYTEVQGLIEDCYKKYNKPLSDGTSRQYPLCAAEMKDAMDAAVDTPTCIRRSNMITNLNPQVYCDPLGDYNVYGFMQPVRSDVELKEDTIVMATAKLDSLSMFDSLYNSADTAVSGIVTLLAAAETLGKVKADFVNAPNPLMFTLFSGEPFEYIGSMRVVYDMEKGEFPYKLNSEQVGVHPIGLSNIHTFFEVSQVGREDQGKLWMHTDPISRSDPDISTSVTNLLNLISNVSSGVSLDIDTSPEVQPLPPASLQSFLKKANISGVVIADHEASFTNTYYHSMYDKPYTINVTYPDGLTPEEQYNYVTPGAEHLSKVATMTAKTLYELSTGNPAPAQVEVNATLMANLLYCYAVNASCELFNYTLDPFNAGKITNKSLTYYVSTSGNTLNWVTKVTTYLLHYYLGDIVTLTTEQCKDYKDGDEYDFEKCCTDLDAHKYDMFYKYRFIHGPVDASSDNQKRIGVCYKSTVNDSEAKSPAFDIKDYNWDSNQYSAWSESRWATDAIYVRYFLVPPLDMEVTTLCVGVIILLCSFPLVYFINKRADTLFTDPGIL